jgi:hypothetical protein
LRGFEKSLTKSSRRETLEPNEAPKAHDPDFEPISEDYETTRRVNESHEAADEGKIGQISYWKVSPLNDHKQDIGNAEMAVKGHCSHFNHTA